MKNAAAALAMALVVATISVGAKSDRVGVYGVIDKVVFEPSAENPERIQIWGAFAIAKRNDNNFYDEVQRGYLYFTAGSSRAARAEWNDLKSVAGSKRIVAFSSRFGQSVRVRAANEALQQPDKYVTGIGVTRVQADRDYAPIRALAAYITR